MQAIYPHPCEKSPHDFLGLFLGRDKIHFLDFTLEIASPSNQGRSLNSKIWRPMGSGLISGTRTRILIAIASAVHHHEGV